MTLAHPKLFQQVNSEVNQVQISAQQNQRIRLKHHLVTMVSPVIICFGFLCFNRSQICIVNYVSILNGFYVHIHKKAIFYYSSSLLMLWNIVKNPLEACSSGCDHLVSLHL